MPLQPRWLAIRWLATEGGETKSRARVYTRARMSAFLVAPKLSIKQLHPVHFGCTETLFGCTETLWLHRNTLVAPERFGCTGTLSAVGFLDKPSVTLRDAERQIRPGVSCKSDQKLVEVAKQVVLRKMRPAFFH